MAKPGSDRDGAMVEKTAGKKSKEKISPFTKTPKLDRSEILGKDGKSKSSMKRKLSFTVSPQRNEERDSDTDKDGPDKKKVKKESCSKKSTPVNILFGYPLSERKQMALLMQMTARDNSPDTTPCHPSQSPAVQKKIPSSSSTRQKDKVNKRNERGETALHMAAIRGDVKQVKELIGLGADVNVKDFAGWTPLHEACNLGYYDVAKVLIGAGAEVNTQGLDDDTPLHDASSSGHKDIVKLLLRHGGNAFQLNKRGERPVDVADSQELEQLLKGEIPLSDPEESTSESEDPPSVNPSSVDENMEYSDAEKDSDSKSTTVKASSSMSGLDEYEFKDEEEEEDLSKALNDRHILRRELRQKEKEEKERNHYASKQGSKSEQLTSKSKKTKASRVYCSSDSSSDEAEVPPERRSSPTRSVSVDGPKSDGRSKKESLNLTPVEQKEKCKQKKKNKSQSKNKENQEVREEGKENSKSLLFTTATVSDNSDKGVREEDSFKMSFSAKDDTSVHLFHLSVVKSPKLNHSQTDKQTAPLKQENTKTCVSIGDGPCPADSVKYDHYTESDFCTEGSSSKSCKHKEKSKHHHKELGLDGDDGSSSPFKDSSLSNSMDSTEGAFRKTDKDGKVVKKHKLKHKEKEKYRKEYEAERNRHRQKEPRKEGHRNMEFDREFWKENFFKSDENEELGVKCEMLGEESPLKSLESSPAKEEKGASKDKHSSSSSSKDRRTKEEREKDKGIKKEKKEMPLKDERGREGKGDELDDRTEGLGSGRMHEGSQHISGVKEETEDKPITGNSANQDPLGSAEKNTREKNDKRQLTKDREAEKSDKKLSDKDKKIKSEHLAEKPELHNSTDRWKEKEKLTSSSHSPNDKSHKESEKLKAVSAMKKHEENKKNKDKRSEKEHSSSDHRDRDKTSSEKKVKAPEKTTDHGKSDRTKDKEREKDSDKRKKEKLKETNPSSSSYSNLKLLLEEKKGYICENNKVVSSKSKEEVTKSLEKDKERRERERESERHRERERGRHKEKDKDRSQLNKDGKLGKTKPNEVEFKSKVAPTLKDTHRKEKRLVNDDLMKTSFERMLSLKDQEIEQWHKKHLEKIKQKERERLKQRPGVDLGKQKSKEKTNTKTSSSSSEPCLNKELTRSKSSDAPDGHREKILKDATGGRTVSLDAKNLSTLGKNGPVIENSRSPRPETERSGLMSRSVSMISVASSEDSCQTTMLTPRLTEEESDLNTEASDSQPPCLQASLILQSSRSPTVHDKDTSGLPDTASCNRTPLLTRHASPCLRAILDEEAKAPLAETRPNEVSQRIGFVSQPSNEQTAIHSAEISVAPVQETYSTLPNGKSNEGEDVTSACQGQPSSCLHESSTKDLGSQPANITQANNVVQTHTEQNMSGTHVDQLDVPGITIPEGSNKDPLLDVVSTPVSFQPSPKQISSDNSAPVHLESQQMETLNSRSKQSLREDSSLKQELNVVAENQTDKSGESVTQADWTSTPSPSVGSCRSEETAKALLQEDLKKDTSEQEEATSWLSSEPLSTVEALQEKHEQDAASVTYYTSQERLPVEPMETSEEASDKNRIPETDGAIWPSSEGETTQALTERSDQLAGEEKPAQSDIPSSGEQSDNNSDTGARAKVQGLDEEADMQLTHPRKRKMSRVSATAQSDLTTPEVREKTQQSLAAIVDSLKLEEIQPYQTERANPYYEYLHIRKKIEEKRKILCSVIPQAPQYYDEYVTFNGSYLLDGNPLSKLCIPTITPPPSLPEPLKEMFKQQEVMRMKLRLQHSIEREKLIVSNEQEVLRVHYRAARTLANQTLPFSACTVLLDAEVYNMPQDVQGDDGKTSVRDRFNARQFMSWLQDVDDKFDKLKTCLLMRQQHEAAALNAVQRLEWQLKLQELDPATYKSTSIFEIPEFYIPLVEVNDDFDLTPI
ncbi:Ankyrin repeat domain-containing protein 12 [Triplophysa tibetana]|uniref:Ankyrin repeat domain-containing protein 12 n=1 Tax=Triplophysa tibetana TaxID=1572043 RepID=A0A5A9P7T0_9TELE|nr:Ankyrin repeat domain-containing protein 12 [Triplophysa tibetana]